MDASFTHTRKSKVTSRRAVMDDQITFTCTSEMKAKLVIEAENRSASGVPVNTSDLCREAVAQFLEKGAK